VGDVHLGRFYDAVSSELSSAENAISANYIASDITGLLAQGTIGEEILMGAEKRFSTLMRLVAGKKLSSRAAKDMLVPVLNGEDPEAYAQREGLFQTSDENALLSIAKVIIAENPDAVADYKSGKAAALQSLVGKGMKATKGSANPEMLKEAFSSLLA
jgi:aspartyl-tRNA(Asn)/glutamyl-tRNA(Gln) amidotransferase subunit B